jgi:T-complex protein 1 subunit theta
LILCCLFVYLFCGAKTSTSFFGSHCNFVLCIVRVRQVVPRTLAENAGMNSTDTIASLYAAHNDGKVSLLHVNFCTAFARCSYFCSELFHFQLSAGIDVEALEISDAHGVFDVFSAKDCAIKLATDAACTVLRVDQIIMSKPAGGPKAPTPGARDDD